MAIFPDLNELSRFFDDVQIRPLRIPEYCKDGFFAAFWKRPFAYLHPEVRQAILALPALDVGYMLIMAKEKLAQ